MSAQPRFEKLYRAYVAVVIPPVRDGTYIVTYHARRWPELAVDRPLNGSEDPSAVWINI